MLTTEFEEELQMLTDAELLRCAVKYFKLSIFNKKKIRYFKLINNL